MLAVSILCAVLGMILLLLAGTLLDNYNFESLLPTIVGGLFILVAIVIYAEETDSYRGCEQISVGYHGFVESDAIMEYDVHLRCSTEMEPHRR